MNFTTNTFLLFFIIVFFIYWLLRKTTAKNMVLLIASYIFYGWIHPWYAVLLGLSTFWDYRIALAIYRKKDNTKKLVGLSLFLNIGVLFFFKYFNFFKTPLIENLELLGIEVGYYFVSLVLPLGLSFFTLKKIGYIIDVSKGRLEPTKNFIVFNLFVAFFPQLAAGPIDKAQDLIPQFEASRKWKWDFLYLSWRLILMGVFKKVVIANSIGSFTSRLFGLDNLTGLLAIAAALGFTLQILADFSAYTDISRGISFLLGIRTPENFNSPYLSLTPSDFWDRWHITLSHWLRDYVFFPLRRAFLKKRGSLPLWIIQALPPLITMLISGVWHGAGWTYILWGGGYGVLIVAYQLLGINKTKILKSRVQTLFAWLIMFSFIVFGWLVFRASSLEWVIDLFSHPFIGSQAQLTVAILGLVMVLFYSAPLMIKFGLDKYFSDDSFIHSVYYVVITVMIIVYINSVTPDFIYFQF